MEDPKCPFRASGDAKSYQHCTAGNLRTEHLSLLNGDRFPIFVSNPNMDSNPIAYKGWLRLSNLQTVRMHMMLHPIAGVEMF